MAEECHALLKGMCALKGVSVSDYCYSLLRQEFQKVCREDKRVRQMLTSGEYPPQSSAAQLKEQILKEFPNE